METPPDPEKQPTNEELQAELNKAFGTAEEASRQENFQFLKDIADEKATMTKEKSEKKKK